MGWVMGIGFRNQGRGLGLGTGMALSIICRFLWRSGLWPVPVTQLTSMEFR